MKRNSIEDIKDFWNNRPCNIRHSNAEIGTKDYFDAVEKRKYFVEPHIPRFAEFPKWKNKSVLEIGCGIGTDAANFARNGALYNGVELSEKSLAIAKRRFDVYNLTGTFYSGNAEELSKIVPSKKFDLIYSFGVIHHTPNPERIIFEIKKFMNHESEFRLMLYAKNSWKNIMIEAGLDQPEAQFGCPIANTYTEQEARRLLSDFEIIDIRQDHIFPFVIDKYIKYEYEKQSWFANMPDVMFHCLEKKLGWHLLIKCKLKSQAIGNAQK